LNSHTGSSIKVTKAVLPVAGLGTRMLPATKSIAKEMLTLVDKPLIHYVANEAVAAGIKQIILVTHPSKKSIENYFIRDLALESSLEAKGKTELLDELRSILPHDVEVKSVIQSSPLGLGHALLSARSLIGEQPFTVLLPDVLINHYRSDLAKDNLAEMIKNFEQTATSQIMVEQVSFDKVDQYGVVDLNQVKILPGESAPIADMVEKPALDKTPSNLVITGRYVLCHKIFDLLESTTAGAGGEIQLTDALHQLCNNDKIDAYHLKGQSFDCGSKLGYLLANTEFALNNKNIGEQFKAALEKLLGNKSG